MLLKIVPIRQYFGLYLEYLLKNILGWTLELIHFNVDREYFGVDEMDREYFDNKLNMIIIARILYICKFYIKI